MKNINIFKGRDLIIATKHEKEKVIAPILEKELGVKCFINTDLDTDKLGTFTGEIERKEDPIITARIKCHQAMELANCDLAIASEGSFGAHPSIFFVSADDEFLVLIDKLNHLEIIARELSTTTNFNGSTIKTEKELIAFAETINFPSHGLIIRKEKDDNAEIVKGITNSEHLISTFNHFISHYGTAYVETDMRAMYNPMRMEVIKKAALNLSNKIKNQCPNCQTPGFGVTGTKKGLTCKICKTPTQSILYHIYTCQKCNYKKEEIYPNGKQWEEPIYCDICNP